MLRKMLVPKAKDGEQVGRRGWFEDQHKRLMERYTNTISAGSVRPPAVEGIH